MSTRDRNEWLEADIDEEENAYESEEREESRGTILTNARKRLKTRHDPTSDINDDGENENSNHEATGADSDGDASSTPTGRHKRSPQSSLNPILQTELSKAQKQLAKKRDAISRSGVIYISHIPPFMKPHT